MPQRKTTESHIRKLTKTGGGRSMSITLPIGLVRELKWREKQKVVVKKDKQRMIIQDWKKGKK